jgi:calcyclin binding protein
MADTTEPLAAEVVELQTLLAQTKTAGNRRDLEQLLQHKQKALEAAAEPQQPEPMEVETPEPVKLAPRPAASDLTTFTEISRFGWEDDGYGKEKVAVYVMSGVDGVGVLPKENVTCHFTKTSFDLKVRCNGVGCIRGRRLMFCCCGAEDHWTGQQELQTAQA